jgi:type VI secretion system protein ImpH
MESPTWQTIHGLIEELAETPFEFDFFRAVRLLEAAAPEFPRTGTSKLPADDPVRFGQNPFMVMAPSTLDEFDPGDNESPARLLVRFFGLFGPNGPMPLHFTQHALTHLHARLAGRKAESDEASDSHEGTDRRALLDFCDLFHHRLISLFYRAWAVNQQTADFDRAITGAQDPAGAQRGEQWSAPRFALYIGSVFGLGMESLRDRGDVPDNAKLYYAGHLARQTRNADGLRSILADYFEVPVQIEPFLGTWIELPPDSHSRLGEETAALGKTTHLGARFWDRQMSFRVRVGPMKLVEFNRFLPRERAFRHLKEWILGYVGEELGWEVQLVIEAEEVPSCKLGQQGLLGWNTWLKSRPFTKDAEDTILNGDRPWS